MVSQGQSIRLQMSRVGSCVPTIPQHAALAPLPKCGLRVTPIRLSYEIRTNPRTCHIGLWRRGLGTTWNNLVRKVWESGGTWRATGLLYSGSGFHVCSSETAPSRISPLAHFMFIIARSLISYYMRVCMFPIWPYH